MSVTSTSIPNRLLDPAWLRSQTVGIDHEVETPFGRRLLVYADYTASGRALHFVEDHLREVSALYANSHTEDDVTGRAMTGLLHEAEARIKRVLNAGPDGLCIACGTGATGALHKLHEILGLALPPATRERIGFDPESLGDRRPVVFVGPYEHHSNEVTWREGLAEVVPVCLDEGGGVCLRTLERHLQDERWQGRPRFGAFSAASNVTGRLTPVHEVARLLRRHDAIGVFDYAAAAPYVAIDMCPADDPEAWLDAVAFSPHKFIGGPGAAGVLVLNQKLYRRDLAPTVGGGGTVDYVGPHGHDFSADVEAREKAGTPGILQTLRAALALDVQQAVGVERIHAREAELLGRAFRRWHEHDRIHILGDPDPARRIGIVSFNLKALSGEVLHPRLVTGLLNDLFGIQSRAGCSCAGPYGHCLLGIGEEESESYRATIREGLHGLKPGWCRVGFHYTMDDAEADYVIEAVAFLAEHGERFLGLYDFDLESGTWVPNGHTPYGGMPPLPHLSLAAALRAPRPRRSEAPLAHRRHRYEAALEAAHGLARSAPDVRPVKLEPEAEGRRFFALATASPAESVPAHPVPA
jgi:selenocysteine lyase/cysteine desulfurase